MRNLVYWLICKHGKSKLHRHDDPNRLSNNIAVDISFGTTGYALILSRIFKSVCLGEELGSSVLPSIVMRPLGISGCCG